MVGTGAGARNQSVPSCEGHFVMFLKDTRVWDIVPLSVVSVSLVMTSRVVMTYRVVSRDLQASVHGTKTLIMS